ncbi:MAG TPA: transcription-repair coupling factor, partial [Firmicutes bacterium]|nr:transcription-repair coupling factor [Bacillota bacterium]
KQVAVLVPTTILAQQHYQTFLDRFADFPAISIRSLSRFQSPKEQKETLKLLAQGRVDIVIGTHRLLSNDIIFKNLGLLIVDEEQRFGVIHKERIKEMRKNVDVLTLTATPIPRTLHMALVGVRDMSVIETPPEDRFPVRTYVTEYNDGLIQEAIQRELARGGQIYFVYNRIESIDQMANHLQELVPDARILIGHGQMSEDMLERVMLDFIDGEADILLCTTIIESGMDIANVNTLIVYDADRLGLAQLYQLRGRVGRSNRIAYAYFTFRKDKVVNEVAEKRLQAIRDFTELGSGFKIAMRDLEIRGAGNLLGAEQHGHITSVGFEMYCRLLEEAVQELRGNYQPEPPDTAVELPLDAYLPDTYIPDVRQKVEMYKKIAAVRNATEAEQLAVEMKDRFGELPEEVANLVTLSVFRARFRAVGVQSISTERDALVIRFHEGVTPDSAKVQQLLRQKRPRVTYHTGKGVQLRVHGAVAMAQVMGAGAAAAGLVKVLQHLADALGA